MGGKVGERHTKTNRSSRFSTPILFPLLLFLLFLFSASELRVVVTMKVFRSREKGRKERGKERRKEDRKEKAMNITISIANHKVKKSLGRSFVRSFRSRGGLVGASAVPRFLPSHFPTNRANGSREVEKTARVESRVRMHL